jgi:hypothetical protein
VHSVALSPDAACRHQVAAQRSVFGQVGSEVHLLPFELFAQAILPWKPEFSEVPPTDKVNLAILGAVVDLMWVALVALHHSLRVECLVGPVVPQQEAVLLSVEPPFLCGELNHLILVHHSGYSKLGPADLR